MNYGRFWGRQSQVHSYINPALFMGNYKTPRIFFLPPETSFEVSVRCCHFFKTCLLVDFCSLESFFFFLVKTSALTKSTLHDGFGVIYN